MRKKPKKEVMPWRQGILSHHKRGGMTQKQMGDISDKVRKEVRARSGGICELRIRCHGSPAVQQAHITSRVRITTRPQRKISETLVLRVISTLTRHRKVSGINGHCRRVHSEPIPKVPHLQAPTLRHPIRRATRGKRGFIYRTVTTTRKPCETLSTAS